MKRSFCRAAARAGLDPWQASHQYFSELTECVGDSAAFTVSRCEMEGDSCSVQAARFHENGYQSSHPSLAEDVAAQYELFSQGDAGIQLRQGEDELYFDLHGITVYNRTLLARTVEITVNGVLQGSFELSREDFITLIPLEITKLPGDRPVEIRIRITNVEAQVPDLAILDAWPGLGGSISGSR